VKGGEQDGRLGVVYDQEWRESKVRLDGDVAGSWFPNDGLEVVPCPEPAVLGCPLNHALSTEPCEDCHNDALEARRRRESAKHSDATLSAAHQAGIEVGRAEQRKERRQLDNRLACQRVELRLKNEETSRLIDKVHAQHKELEALRAAIRNLQFATHRDGCTMLVSAFSYDELVALVPTQVRSTDTEPK
jgi:hypothetical protein